MIEEYREKLKEKIISGQSLNMLSWEFKLKKQVIIDFAKKNNLVLRKNDYLRYANKMYKK